ncbi:hypothetical protein CHU98_g9883 [Xylaria longipes]|nr:hypothetical protein CHU98_g9883 [Xylaria longipes]
MARSYPDAQVTATDINPPDIALAPANLTILKQGNIHEYSLRWPLGEWADNDRERKIGAMASENFTSLVGGVGVMLLTKDGFMSDEKAKVFQIGTTLTSGSWKTSPVFAYEPEMEKAHLRREVVALHADMLSSPSIETIPSSSVPVVCAELPSAGKVFSPVVLATDKVGMSSRTFALLGFLGTLGDDGLLQVRYIYATQNFIDTSNKNCVGNARVDEYRSLGFVSRRW